MEEGDKVVHISVCSTTLLFFIMSYTTLYKPSSIALILFVGVTCMKALL